ncbi:MAG: ParB/RepB/Spo0J family partition protein [Novosphingobium sp.]
MTELNRRTAMFNRAATAHPDLAVDAVSQARLIDLKIDGVQPDPGNPRRHFEQAKLEELARSFQSSGIIQPIVVRPGEGGAHIIIAGERRWRAAKIAGHVSIKAIIRPGLQDEATLLFAQIAENESREDLCTRDLVDAVVRLIGLDVAKKDIAARFACDPSRISRLIALAELPPELQPFLDTMQVDPLYELSQHWKRNRVAVEDLLSRDSQPTRATIRKLADPESLLNPAVVESDRSPELAPAQVGSTPKLEMPKSSTANDRFDPMPLTRVSVRVRHPDHGEGRVVYSPSVIGNKLPVLYGGQEALIQTALEELTILAIE